MKLIVTIDVEEDSGPGWVSPPVPTFKGVTHGLKNILCPMFDELGVKASLMLSPIVLQDIASVEILRQLGNVELAAHLHWEQIGPHQERSLQGGPGLLNHMQWDFPPDKEREKLEALTELFRQQFGFLPTAFRAGRYGASPATGAILKSLGYKVDTSVTPHVPWRTPGGHIVDYTNAPEQPYYTGGNNNIFAKGGDDLLEIPITIMPREDFPGMMQHPWLRPTYASRDVMKEMIFKIRERNEAGVEQPLVMMFHNVEVIPNASPYTKTEEDVSAYLADMRDVLEYALALGFEPETLSEYADYFAKKKQKPSRSKPASSIAFPHPQVDHLPRILICVDAPMWAHDFKSNNIIRHLSGRFDFRKRYHKDIAAEDFEWCDGILIYYWKQLIELQPFIHYFSHKATFGGISCPTDLEGEAFDIGMGALRSFSSVFVHNQILFEEYKNRFSQPFYLNQNGVDTDFYKPASTSSAGKPLIVGWAGSLKNHGPKRGYYDIILPAVAQTPGVELRTAAREDKWRGPDEMLEFYRGLDVYLVASRVEGTPNPGLESAACGCALISTPVGNMPELIQHGENGFLIDHNAESMAMRLIQLRDDLPLLQQMRQNIRRDIMAWDWSIKAELYGRMFAETFARYSKASAS